MTAPSANGHRAKPPHRPVDWSAQYQPGPSTPLLHCGARAAAPPTSTTAPGHQAHIAVFAYSPRLRQAISPPQEDPS